jgi:hypothetical protein
MKTRVASPRTKKTATDVFALCRRSSRAHWNVRA